MDRQQLLRALSDAEDRKFLLCAEADLCRLLKEAAAGGEAAPASGALPLLLRFPRMDAYCRLLVHTTARRFGIRSVSEPLWEHEGRKWVYCSVGPASAEPLLLYRDYLPGVATPGGECRGGEKSAAPLRRGTVGGGGAESSRQGPHLPLQEDITAGIERGGGGPTPAGSSSSPQFQRRPSVMVSTAGVVGEQEASGQRAGGVIRLPLGSNVAHTEPSSSSHVGDSSSPSSRVVNEHGSNTAGPIKGGGVAPGTGQGCAASPPPRIRKGRGSFRYVPEGAEGAAAPTPCTEAVLEKAVSAIEEDGEGKVEVLGEGRVVRGGMGDVPRSAEEETPGTALDGRIRERLEEVELGARVLRASLPPTLPPASGRSRAAGARAQHKVVATSDHILEVTSVGQPAQDGARVAPAFAGTAAVRRVSPDTWLAVFDSLESAQARLLDGRGGAWAATAASAGGGGATYTVRAFEESKPSTLAACGWPDAGPAPRRARLLGVEAEAARATQRRLVGRGLGQKRR